MPNYGYHLGRLEGAVRRRVYRALLPAIVRRPVAAPRNLPFEVFSYSGEAGLPEQVAAIRSFLLHAGRPAKFTVVSDGTHSKSSCRLLRQIDPVVSVVPVPAPPSNCPPSLSNYLRGHPTGKQLALIVCLPAERPALYLDSDVLFFPGASDIAVMAASATAPAFYLEDCGFAGDRRILRNASEESRPVNTGVLMLFKPLDWSEALARFLELKGEPTFFTNQTIVHLAMHQNGAQPFDPAKYVLQLDDQFIYQDRYVGPATALRHYVAPVRHKFWTAPRL